MVNPLEMLSMRTKTISIIFMAILLVGITNTSAKGINSQYNNGITTLETDSMVIEIKGATNIPAFFFYAPGNDTDTYRLQLDSIFEIIDDDGNGIYDAAEDTLVPNSNLALASLNWEFSDFITDTDGETVTAIHFNITSTEALGNNPTDGNLILQFRIHMDLVNEAELKFDVVVDGYEFVDANAMFVIAFKLTTTENVNMVRTQSKFSFGNAFFESETTANDTNGEMKVAVSYGESADKKLYIAYEHFDGRMVHDPTIGLTSGETENGELPILDLFVFSSAILAIVIVRKRK